MKAKKLYPDVVMRILNLTTANLGYVKYEQIPEANRNIENTTSDYFSIRYVIKGDLCFIYISVDMSETASEKYTDYIVASGCPLPLGGGSMRGLVMSNDGINSACFVNGNGELVISSYDRDISNMHLHGVFIYMVDWEYPIL